MSLGFIAAIAAILGLIGAGAWGINKASMRKVAERAGRDKANLQSAKVGEDAQQAEDKEFHDHRGSVVDEYERMLDSDSK